MIDAAATAGVLLMVVKQNRYDLPVTLLRETMPRGRLGNLIGRHRMPVVKYVRLYDGVRPVVDTRKIVPAGARVGRLVRP